MRTVEQQHPIPTSRRRSKLARKRKKRRNLLISAGILPERGAKPKSGAQLRQIYRTAKPTPETILRKAEVLGAVTYVDGIAVVPKDFNYNTPALPLDLLLHNPRLPGWDKGSITDQQYVAAMRLGFLRFAVLGKRGPSLSQFHMAEQMMSDHAPDRALTEEEKAEAAERAHDRWFEAMGYLKHRAPLAIGPLHTLLDGDWPRTSQVRRAIKGLELLVKLWRIA